MFRQQPIRTRIQLAQTSHIQRAIVSEPNQSLNTRIIANATSRSTLHSRLEHKWGISPLLGNDVVHQGPFHVVVLQIFEIVPPPRRGIIPAIRVTVVMIGIIREALDMGRVIGIGVCGENPSKAFVRSQRAGEDECAEANRKSILVVRD